MSRCAFRFLSFCLMFLLLLGTLNAAHAQTSFSYSGKLASTDNGNYDFKFTLYTAATAGTQVGSPLTISTVPVTNGAYTVTLDFAATSFANAPLWMQIAYRVSGGTTFTNVNGRVLETSRFSLLSLLSGNTLAIGGYPVSSAAPSTGQALEWNGSAWSPASISGGGTYQAGAGLALNGNIFSIASAGVVSSMLASGAVTASAIASGAVTSSALAAGAVTSAAIAAGAVGTTALASGAVTSAKLANGAVTSSAIASGAVTSSALASGAVTSSAIANGAVTASALASGAVTSSAIASGAVTTPALASGAVTVDKIGWPLSETLSSGSALLALTNNSSGDGLYAFSSSGTGVYGQSASGAGLYGQSSTGSGLYAYSGSGGKGVWGYSSSGFGVEGQSDSSDGVYGYSGSGMGGYFQSSSGTGVQGVSNGVGAGVSASSASGDGGDFYANSGSGVFGQSSSGDGGDFFAFGNGYGVSGASSSGDGVWGSSSGSGAGVFGRSNSGDGGDFISNSYIGVYGQCDSYIGVFGYSYSSIGVSGSSNSGNGVEGYSNGPGYAGLFVGNVFVNGTLSAANKQFKIDHPLDPANKYLVHSCVESDQMKTFYDGHVTTDANGDAVVILPDYFQALNRDFEYHLTVIGQFAQAIISHEIANNQFAIKTDKPNVKVSWQVTGIRQDSYANAHPMEVEPEKPADKKGKFLHPKELGYPESMGEDYEQQQKALHPHP